MIICDCPKCTEADNKQKEKALQEWAEGRHDIRYDSWEYKCGDGCCHEYGTNLFINDYLFTDCAYDLEPHRILDFLGISYNLTEEE